MNDSEISIIKNEKSLSITKTDNLKNENTYKNSSKQINSKLFFYFYICFILIVILMQIFIIYNLKSNQYNFCQKNHNNNTSYLSNKDNNKRKYDFNFIYEDYDNNIITEKIKKYSGWELRLEEAKFINGIIRKNKLKKCLEIGVSQGGSSILILNSIKNFEDSILVSLDLNKELYTDPNKNTGYRVNQYFPELSKNWKLYTGEQPHKFLVNLNIKFDFLFLDSTHVSPGELLNFIEALPFLNENAIVVIHDLLWHFSKVINTKFFPSCISLIPTLYGDKVFIKKHNVAISNMGAIFLYKNQEEHYLDYFLLLLNFWEYIPTEIQIDDLRHFIKTYYRDDIYINIFDLAVMKNKKVNKKFVNYNKNLEEKKYLISLGTKWNITDSGNRNKSF